MFGIDQISWEQFTRFILFVLILWYLSFIFYSWFRQKHKDRKMLFEENFSGSIPSETLNPVSVSSQDFPAEVIPYHLVEDIHLPVSFYEESGLDEGYAISCFTEPNEPHLSKILEQIQYQQ